jgi:hypothetical protein
MLSLCARQDRTAHFRHHLTAFYICSTHALIPLPFIHPWRRVSLHLNVLYCDVFDCRQRSIPDTAGNNCKLVDNRIRDTFAPFLVTTIGLYGYEANNGMRGYVATGESALEVSRRQLVFGSRRGQSSSVYASA